MKKSNKQSFIIIGLCIALAFMIARDILREARQPAAAASPAPTESSK